MIELLTKKENLRKIGIAIFLIYIFCICFTISANTAYDSAPDEKMKYDVCKYVYFNMKLPHGGDESIRDEIWGQSYAFSPILSYMASGVFMKVTSVFTKDPFALVVAARFVSVLCITGYAFMCIKISEKLFKGIYKWLFVIFVTMLPQLLYLGSYINNDSLALLTISIIVYAWIIGIEENWSWKSCIILAIGLGICALSYYNAYGFILCSVIIYCISNYIKKIKFKEFFKKGIVIFLIAFALAGWWFIRNFIIYDGDFLGMSTSREYSEKYALEQYKPSNRQTPANQGYSLNYMLKNMYWIEVTKRSFIGFFGYMSVQMDLKIYDKYIFFAIIGIIGLAIIPIKAIVTKIINKIKKKERDTITVDKIKKQEKILFNVIMAISVIIPIALSMYYSYSMDFQPQGRYIMPMIIPFMYFITIGIQNLFKEIIKKENILIAIIIAFWVIMPIYIMNTYIINVL